MMIIRGVNVFPTQIEELILKDAALAPHYQLEITRPGNLDELTVMVGARAGGGIGRRQRRGHAPRTSHQEPDRRDGRGASGGARQHRALARQGAAHRRQAAEDLKAHAKRDGTVRKAPGVDLATPLSPRGVRLSHRDSIIEPPGEGNPRQNRRTGETDPRAAGTRAQDANPVPIGPPGVAMEVSFSREAQMLRLGHGACSTARAFSPSPRRCCSPAWPMSAATRARRCRTCSTCMVQAEDYLDELGVHVEACSNEASAAAMLGASIHYPLRGAVTWKSIVGTNVAADALSNLVVAGRNRRRADRGRRGLRRRRQRDPGAHACVCAQVHDADARSAAGAGPTWCAWWKRAFALSEASNMPAMLELRIRACHVRGSFVCKDNVAPAISTRHLMEEPAKFDYARAGAPAGDFPPREAQRRGAHPGGAPLHRRAQSERIVRRQARRPGHHRAGRPVQLADPRAAAVRPGRCVRRSRTADPGAQRHLSAGAGGDCASSAWASARC